jgi:hypothetical protein
VRSSLAPWLLSRRASSSSSSGTRGRITRIIASVFLRECGFGNSSSLAKPEAEPPALPTPAVTGVSQMVLPGLPDPDPRAGRTNAADAVEEVVKRLGLVVSADDFDGVVTEVRQRLFGAAKSTTKRRRATRKALLRQDLQGSAAPDAQTPSSS